MPMVESVRVRVVLEIEASTTQRNGIVVEAVQAKLEDAIAKRTVGEYPYQTHFSTGVIESITVEKAH